MAVRSALIQAIPFAWQKFGSPRLDFWFAHRLGVVVVEGEKLNFLRIGPKGGVIQPTKKRGVCH